MMEKLEGLEGSFVYTKLLDSIKEVIDPYISIKNNEARIGLRVRGFQGRSKLEEMNY